MQLFVFSKMQAEAGEGLEAIVARKELERLAGGGIFWWGIGNSLGKAVYVEAEKAGRTLPILFLKMPSDPKPEDRDPDMNETVKWTAWKDDKSVLHDVPEHVKVTSRGGSKKKRHYALICRSEIPLSFSPCGPFDPINWRTLKNNKIPASNQVTSLLRGDHLAVYPSGRYQIGFSATLVEPWVVRLVNPVLA